MTNKHLKLIRGSLVLGLLFWVIITTIFHWNDGDSYWFRMPRLKDILVPSVLLISWTILWLMDEPVAKFNPSTTYLITIRARHFKGADLTQRYNTPLANAIREQFNLRQYQVRSNTTTVGVRENMAPGANEFIMKHEHYGLTEYHADVDKASRLIANGHSEAVVRAVYLTPGFIETPLSKTEPNETVSTQTEEQASGTTRVHYHRNGGPDDDGICYEVNGS